MKKRHLFYTCANLLLATYFMLNGILSHAQADEDIRTLTILTLTAEYDDVCDYLDSSERNLLQTLIAYKALELGTTLEELNNAAGNTEFDCESELFTPALEGTKQVLRNFLDAQPAEEETAANGRPMIFDMLEEAMAPLNKGELGAYVGCWLGSMFEWEIELCFKEGGDQIAATLTSPNENVSCELPFGQARRREGGIIFYSYREDYLCSDGSRLEHIEGFCNDIGDGLDCLLSVFSKDNYFYLSGDTSLTGSTFFSKK